jgi:hypothetical protein
MTDDDKSVLVCCRVADIDPPAISTVTSCDACGKAVWCARSSPPADLIWCMQCAAAAAKAAGEAVMFEPPTKQQLKDLKNWRR